VVRAYGSLAGIYRERQAFENAARARARQEALIGEGAGRAALWFEMGLDAVYQERGAWQQARDLFRRSQLAAAAEGDEISAHRAVLGLCLLDSARGQGAGCRSSATASVEALQDAGIPWLAADASLAQARILRAVGEVRTARDGMDRLIRDLYWYRRALPGVTDPWYAHNRDELMREYLALVRAAAPETAAGGGDGEVLLLAMERVRMLENADFRKQQDAALDAAEDEAIRGLLARREAASRSIADPLAGEIHRRLELARRGASSLAAEMPALELAPLLRQLERSQALLAFHFDGRRAQALVARRAGVEAIALAGSERIQADLAQLRDAWASPGSADLPRLVEALGWSLLAPLEGALPEEVYLLPTGPLRGIPLDALRVNGRYFAERHSVVNLVALASIAHRAPLMPEGFSERVFLAGNPQEQGDPFSLDLRISPEIAAVTDQFVGPGLHIVQGVALQKHEFEDQRFAQAALAHLGLAGTLDLAVPDRSRLLLARETAGQVGSRSVLMPTDVRGFDMEAGLVVLSGTAVVGHGLSPVDSRLPLVADFLEAGARAVLVSLRALGEESNADFSVDFYRRLRSDPDIGAALAATKRERIAAESGTNLPDWASFQLFIR
jgi:CHAT domain-containing protein